eukprot:663856-Prymnesium_polylepis.1
MRTATQHELSTVPFTAELSTECSTSSGQCTPYVYNVRSDRPRPAPPAVSPDRARDKAAYLHSATRLAAHTAGATVAKSVCMLHPIVYIAHTNSNTASRTGTRDASRMPTPPCVGGVL